jgi:hypothetical protein
MLLRCGECRKERQVVAVDDVVARYDDDLRAARAAIRRAIEREDRARLAREADAFAVALDRDLIDAADFAL